MSVEFLFTAKDRLLIANTTTGCIDDYQQNTQGVFVRYISNQLEVKYIDGIKEELALKYRTDDYQPEWQPLLIDDNELLPHEFTQAWLDQKLGKE